MRPVHLVADVLDKQLVDKKKKKLGKVDGLVIVLREGKAPRVGYIECGAAVWARRLGRWCERVALALNRRLGVRDKPRYRIPWSKVTKVDIEVVVDVDETPLLAWETWLREHVVGRIPFSK
jgi:sporulation protein YlmC with PRC-barrel domain